jgi:hypothetical protein
VRPAIGLVVSSVLLTGLMLTNYNGSLVDRFSDMILLANLVTLVPYADAAGAQLILLAPTANGSPVAGSPSMSSWRCSPSATPRG